MVLALIGSFLVLLAASIEAGQAGRDPEPNPSTLASTLTPGTAVRLRSTIGVRPSSTAEGRAATVGLAFRF